MHLRSKNGGRSEYRYFSQSQWMDGEGEWAGVNGYKVRP